jgi:hypothetical protein
VCTTSIEAWNALSAPTPAFEGDVVPCHGAVCSLSIVCFLAFTASIGCFQRRHIPIRLRAEPSQNPGRSPSEIVAFLRVLPLSGPGSRHSAVACCFFRTRLVLFRGMLRSASVEFGEFGVSDRSQHLATVACIVLTGCRCRTCCSRRLWTLAALLVPGSA